MIKEINKYKYLIILFLIAISPWVATLWIPDIFGYKDFDAGKFGDMFGAVNSLFTCLALIGLVWANVLQKRMFEQQKGEIVSNKKRYESDKLVNEFFKN